LPFSKAIAAGGPPWSLNMMQRRSFLAASAALLATPALAQSGAWPSRGSIRLIAQFPPGGLVDTVSRLMAPYLGQMLGQTVLVENRAGAGGVIGTDFVAKAPADGYTLLVSHASVHVFAAATLPTLPFDPISDFTHIAHLVEAPNILLVRGASPYRNLAQYLTAAKTVPVRFGSSGIGSAPHMLGAMLAGEAAAPNLDHVPYRGSAPALQDLMANQIESFIDPITTNVAMLKDGTLRALAVSSPQRLPTFPDVPTFAELGYPASPRRSGSASPRPRAAGAHRRAPRRRRARDPGPAGAAQPLRRPADPAAQPSAGRRRFLAHHRGRSSRLDGRGAALQHRRRLGFPSGQAFLDRKGSFPAPSATGPEGGLAR
jgi:tripartite-type tricarboxylate transporter receptor subunit TctC